MSGFDGMDPELSEIAGNMTAEEMRQLANELERRAKVMRWFSICADAEFSCQQPLLGHLRRSLFLRGDSDPGAN
jgi:hypothetical protein